MIMDGLLHHAAREMPKAAPGIAVVAASGFWALPWQQMGYIAGLMLLVLQGAYSVWKWRHEAQEQQKPKPTVPPAHGP